MAGCRWTTTANQGLEVMTMVGRAPEGHGREAMVAVAVGVAEVVGAGGEAPCMPFYSQFYWL